MPLDDVARRYAENLFQSRLEEISEKQRAELVKVRTDHAQRNMMMSGSYLAAHARVLVEQIRMLGEARADSLLRAYEKAGLTFDDAAFKEIKSEVMQYCHSQQHNAVASIGQTIGQIYAGQTAPPNLDKSIVNQIVSGVSGNMSRLARSLAIKRDGILLDEMKVRKVYAAGLGKKWDVFVCHASEDKQDFVKDLADGLDKSGLSIWYDDFTLKVGDSLRRRIDDGLANSRYGIVVVSHAFFAKNWPQQELDGLMSGQIAGTGVILPVWHNITADEVHSYSPLLSGIVAAKSSEGLDAVVMKLREAMGLSEYDYRIEPDGTTVVLLSPRAMQKGTESGSKSGQGSRLVFRTRHDAVEFVRASEAERFTFDGKEFLAGWG